jgi:hypothetical protein
MGYPEKGDREPEKTEGRVEGVLRGQSRGERRVWRTVSCDVRAKVSAGEVHEGTWGQGGLQSTEYGGRMKADGRGVALPRPHGDRRARHSLAPTASEARVVKSRFGHHVANGRDAVASLPASWARERQLGWHAVPTLPVSPLLVPTCPLEKYPGGGEGIGCAMLRDFVPILRIACSPMWAHRTQWFSSLRRNASAPCHRYSCPRVPL